jgi:hypothetical protein
MDRLNQMIQQFENISTSTKPTGQLNALSLCRFVSYLKPIQTNMKG